MRSRRWLIALAVIVAVLLVLGQRLSAWYVDYQWYSALDAAEVWRAKAWNLLLLRGGTFLVGTLFVFANLYAVRHSVELLVRPRRVGNLEISEEVSGHVLLLAVTVLSIVIGALLALPHDDWVTIELVRHGAPFGETDPFFRADLGYWLYWLPLESALQLWAIVTLVAVTLVVVFLYALTPSLKWEGGRLAVSAYVRRHLFVLAGVLLLLLAWGYRLDAFGLLHEGSGPMGTFVAIDHRVGIPLNLMLALAAVSTAMLVTWSGWTGHLTVAFITLTVMLVAALTVRQVVPPIAERFVTVASTEAAYREIRNGYTRRAYDVDRLTRPASPLPLPSAADAVRGASVWDGAALERAIGRPREAARPSGGLGWDQQEGRLVAFVVEQPTGAGAAETAPAWGITRVAADVTDERGAPLPRDDPEALVGTLHRPVLVHDGAVGYSVLADSAGVVAAPELRSFRSRLAHAWRLQNPSLLRLPQDNLPVRVMMRRDVRERVGALYPAFAQATRVSPIVWRDSLYWALPLYAVSEWFPLSQEFRLGDRPVRYLRHAAVALVNAHTGRTTAIADEQPDPITATWLSRFPQLFADPATLDPELTRRLPPRLDGLLVITQAFAQVGVRGEHGGPAHLARQSGDTSFSYGTTPPFADRNARLLRVALPLLDAAERLRGTVTTAGGLRYEPRWHPLDSVGPHWQVVTDQLQLAGDSVRGSVRGARLAQGSVRVLPTDGGVVALQTTYVLRPDGTPQVLFVTLLDDARVTVGTTLMEAAGMPMPAPPSTPPTPEEFRERVEALYEMMRDALRRGDWNAFGAAYEALGRLLRSAR